ncbi:MAG: GMP synthase (glutamine-hydrolyzing), partial [Bacteroidota bacterium]
MNEKILILDFGSQYTQLIARRIRELNVYSEIVPYNKYPENDEDIQAVILSGSPFSVTDERALQVELKPFIGRKPVLGICYGAQYIADQYGGQVMASSKREYGKAQLEVKSEDPFLADMSGQS